jgi:putative NADH-flavin reductase
VGVLVWPAFGLFLATRFRPELLDLFGDLGEFSLKAPGLEATARRKQVEAAAALGAAMARRRRPALQRAFLRLLAVLAFAVQGADAVLSGLGPRSNAEAAVTWQGTRAIVRAMQATDVRRIVVVSAAPIGTVSSPGRPKPLKHDPGDGFFMRNLVTPLTKAALGKHYADLAPMEDVLRDSGLDWTVVRSPRLTDKPTTGTYRTAYGQNLRHGFFISRADVAHLMLHVLDEPETIKQTIGLAN